MNILSIQSHVAYGHVGNASAGFPLQRLGADVWPVHTRDGKLSAQFEHTVAVTRTGARVLTLRPNEVPLCKVA